MYISLLNVLITGYENIYGFAPADYTMNGSPGGLERIDLLFGTKLYTSSFSASPVVFGAFPSLHAGWATLHSLYLHHLFPQARVLLCAYVMWVWWATMYLTHHYFVDLIGGSCLAVTVFYIAQRNYLPQIQSGKLFRWHYESVIKGHKARPIRDSRSRANSAAAVTAWQMNGSFVDLETGLVQGVPPHSDTEDEENWEMQELSPAEEENENRSGTLSPSTEGSSAGMDSIWTMPDDDATSATTVRAGENDDNVTVKPSTSRVR
jgi:PAP2 superfamily